MWKILISHYLRPVVEGGLHEALETVTIRGAERTVLHGGISQGRVIKP